MADFPDTTYIPREIENKSGVVYDPTKKTVLYAEDIQKANDEIVAIEEAFAVPFEMYLLVNVSFKICTSLYAGCDDEDYLYIGGGSPYSVNKIRKSDLVVVASSANYGGDIRAIACDDTHVFIAGATTNKVRKLLKSD
jgi:hypothetical protein